MCVPCKPCEGLIPEDNPDGDDGGGCSDQPPEGCSSEDLRKQQEANKKLHHLEAEREGKDRGGHQGATGSRQGTDRAHHHLRRHRRQVQGRAPQADLPRGLPQGVLPRHARRCSRIRSASLLAAPIFCREPSTSSCALTEKAKCCQKNLEWKLEKVTRLIWEQKEADKAWKKADDAFAQIKDLPKWIGDQFTELEKLKDQIAQALNDKDPQKHKWAFYLFFWKFAPGLCKRFKVAICCAPAGGDYVLSEHIGCAPGDWHPSKISEDTLKKLICCAWEYAKTKKVELQDGDAPRSTRRNRTSTSSRRRSRTTPRRSRIASRPGSKR